MKKRLNIPLLLGIVLILISLCFVGFSLIKNHTENQNAQKIVSEIVAFLPPITPGSTEERFDNTMPALQLYGQDYLALLEVPGQDICLPVAAGWDAGKLSSAPRHYFGSAYNNSLIIGGSDRSGQLDFCVRSDVGQTVTVTDMTGARFSYRIVKIERASDVDAARLMDGNPGLTLFTKDSSTFDYIILRCQLFL